MKKYIVIFLVIAMAFGLYSCAKSAKAKEPNVTIVSVLFDVTDPLISLPDSASTVKLFSDLSANHENGAILHTALLSDVRYTIGTTISISPENYFLSNPGQRNLAVDSFIKQAGQAIKQLTNVHEGETHSDLYAVIAGEANRMLTVPAKTREIFVYSNLYDNTDSFSLYRAHDLSMLMNNPEKVEALFKKELPLHDLTGLHIFFIYQPTGYEDGKEFELISTVYQHLFEQAGATVTISANLQNQ